MRIAFLYIAEAYQCYHGAAIAFDLAARPGWEVVNLYNDPEVPRHLERIRAAYGAPPIPEYRLRRSALTRALQRIRLLGMFKSLVMRDNLRDFAGYDAIFAVEDTAAELRKLGVVEPHLIYAPHGTGDRARGFVREVAVFDFVLLAGAKTEARMLREGLVRPGDYALTGSVKVETGARLANDAPLGFARAAPVVLYNAHKEPRLTSWHRFIEPLLAGFAQEPSLNLLVAPHVKLFRRRRAAVREEWRARGTENVIVDPGSDRSLDTSYTAAADIYVGDVSSQVYEFLTVPHPCVFLNAHDIDWRDDPSFAHWHLGDVVDHPEQMMDAIRAAPARHHLYRAAQKALATSSLGDLRPGIAARAADAIVEFLNR